MTDWAQVASVSEESQRLSLNAPQWSADYLPFGDDGGTDLYGGDAIENDAELTLNWN